ncbi:acyltransferase family protein [Alteribacter populi]|uniref:acyltransferase family protein n=1 Tax=Alteribacter populi TaxID=2011011 RepID=UPI000BBAEAE0|nr:acyltransferase family protein [Alteribacter populi]
MKQPNMINEVFFLRSIACLSIVLLHSIERAIHTPFLNGIGPSMVMLFDSIQVFLYFGTPVFIFISELIIAYSYRNKPIPNRFLSKRFLFIFVPFLFMAFFYSLPYTATFSDWSQKFLLNAVIGDFHGYFVLIIFQFYLLHLFFHRFLAKWNPKKVIGISLLINIGYLAVFNFTAPPSIPYGTYIWERFYWVPFLGWIFYFSLGYYCGYYYESFKEWINKNKKPILIAPALTSFLVLFCYHSELLSVHSSKRIDILFHTVALTFFILLIAQQMKRIPSYLIQVSQYSFGIYLLHMFYIHAIDYFIKQTGIQLGISYIFILFTASVILSMGTAHFAMKWKHGQYFVGKIGVGKNGKALQIPPVQEKTSPANEKQLKPGI